MLLCTAGSTVTTGFKGHSHAMIRIERIRLIICKAGMGLTAPSKFLVRKSQKILGQRNPSIAAMNWIAAAERAISRAKWFLMSLPIVKMGCFSAWKLILVTQQNGRYSYIIRRTQSRNKTLNYALQTAKWGGQACPICQAPQDQG